MNKLKYSFKNINGSKQGLQLFGNPTEPLQSDILQKPFFKLNGTDRELALKLMYAEMIKNSEANTWSGLFGGIRGNDLKGGTYQFSRIGRLKFWIASKTGDYTGRGQDKYTKQPESYLAELRATTRFNLPLKHNTFDQALMPTITGGQIMSLYLSERMTAFTFWKDELMGALMIKVASSVDASIDVDYDMSIAGAKAYKLGGQRIFDIPQALIDGGKTKEGAIELYNFFEDKIRELKTQNHNFARGVLTGAIKIVFDTELTKIFRLVNSFQLSINNKSQEQLEGGRIIGGIGGVPVAEMVNTIIDVNGKEIKMFMAETGAVKLKFRNLAGSMDKELGTKYTYLSNLEGAFGGAGIKSELVYVGKQEGFDMDNIIFRELEDTTSSATATESISIKDDILDKFETNTGKGVMPLLPPKFFAETFVKPTIDSFVLADTGVAGDGGVEATFTITAGADATDVEYEINGAVATSPQAFVGTAGVSQDYLLKVNYKINGVSKTPIEELKSFTPETA